MEKQEHDLGKDQTVYVTSIVPVHVLSGNPGVQVICTTSSCVMDTVLSQPKSEN